MTDDAPTPEINLTAEAEEQTKVLLKKHRNGSGWFFWIAGLSLVNSAIMLTGFDWGFVIGLGLTQIIDGIAMAIAEELGGQSMTVMAVIAFICDAIIAGSVVLWGVLARKHYRWAYVTGMILYGIDGLIFLLVQDYLSLGFHAFALFHIFGGFKACGQLKTLAALVSAVGYSEEPSTSAEPISDYVRE